MPHSEVPDQSKAKKPWKREIEFVTEAEPLLPPPLFLSTCESFGLEFESQELERLGLYLALLLANNERINLTAIRDPIEAWHRHLFDSVTLLSVLGELESGEVADIGSGGGLPAIPLAICLPNIDFTMIESTGKKADYLQAMIDAIGLANARVIAERAETLGQDDEHRERYAVVTARAVGAMRVISELCVPLARLGGRVMLIKGERAKEELAEAKGALHKLCVTHETTVSTPTGQIVVLDKRRSTPTKYPRRPGEPKRDPL
ncbi:MAG: 16S rRNA (guanine(527)-N(7))-methyltransferase RsmG [Planctomycetota bacterium]